MRTVVINMRRSTSRRLRVEAALEKTGLNLEIFEATDSAQPDFQHINRAHPSTTIKRKGYSLTISEIACFSSHFRVWQHCVEVDERFLVLEDNVELSNSVPVDELRALILSIPPLEYVELAAFFKRRFNECEPISDTHKLVRYVRGTCGTSAYLITPKGARKLIAGAGDFLEPVDDYMEKPWRHKVIAYSLHPSIFQRASVESTIGANRKQKGPASSCSKIYREMYRIYEFILNRIYLYRS